MRSHAFKVAVLLAAAGLSIYAFPAATASDLAAAPTGVTIPKGYRTWQGGGGGPPAPPPGGGGRR
jgi:hypothetical protein